jgi:hypothetical protein
LEIKEGAPMGEAVRLQPRDPPRVAGVAVDLVMAPLAEPRDERLQRGPRAIAGIDQQDRFAALAGRGITGHATVALEDHPRATGIDELAHLLRRHRGRARPGCILGKRERD